MNPEEFKLTKDHLLLLKNFYVEWCDDEYGAPAINPKRPYGNSSVFEDIAEILEWKCAEYGSEEREEQENKARILHQELEIAMQIVLRFAGSAVKPGIYKRKNTYSNEWEKG